MAFAAAIPALVGAGVGLMKQKEQESQFQQATELAAARTRFSPFNPEITPGDVGKAPSAFQNVLAGALAGGGFAAKNPSLFGGGEGSGESQFAADRRTQFNDLEDPSPEAAAAAQDPGAGQTGFNFFGPERPEGFVPPEDQAPSNFGGGRGRRAI